MISGVAVSGGADSMALAYLCQELEHLAKPRNISITAFVVDHRARQESSREARKVAGWLWMIGTCWPAKHRPNCSSMYTPLRTCRR